MNHSGAPPEGRLAALRELTRLRADLVRDRATALNRLRAALDLAFPELLGSLRLPDRPARLALLAAYPPPPLPTAPLHRRDPCTASCAPSGL